MYVMSIALFNSHSNFVLKILLFRFNANETSVFNFSFLSKKISKMENIQSKMRMYSSGLNPPPTVGTNMLS